MNNNGKNIGRLIAIYSAIFGCVLLCLYVVWRTLVTLLGGLAECPSDFSVITWLDENSNGIRDEGEHPLSDVNILVDFIANPDSPKEWATERTDQNGEALFWFMMNVTSMNLYGTTLRIYPEVPQGYMITTPNSYTSEVCRNRGTTYYFGFVPQDGSETEP